MAADAKFEDGGEAPLRLRAADADDLKIISALTQDAVGKLANIRWQAQLRRFSFMLYRFRQEDREKAGRENRPFERVAAALTIDDVNAICSAGIDREDKDAVFSLLAITFSESEDGAGALTITCAGGAAFEFGVECVNVSLADLTRPWVASGAPGHE